VFGVGVRCSVFGVRAGIGVGAQKELGAIVLTKTVIARPSSLYLPGCVRISHSICTGCPAWIESCTKPYAV
jgi:hypothetical protein